ncbi:MAG: hypothetical protein ABI760_06650 [Ferruginibacter sp.]
MTLKDNIYIKDPGKWWLTEVAYVFLNQTPAGPISAAGVGDCGVGI